MLRKFLLFDDGFWGSCIFCKNLSFSLVENLGIKINPRCCVRAGRQSGCQARVDPIFDNEFALAEDVKVHIQLSKGGRVKRIST